MTPSPDQRDLRDRVAMEHLIRTLSNNAFFCSITHNGTPEQRQTYIQQYADNAFRAADEFLAARERTEEERVPVGYCPWKDGPWRPAARSTVKEGE